MDPYEGLDVMEVLIKYDLIQNPESTRTRVFSKLVGAALGSIPWVGGYLSALSDFRSDNLQNKNNKLYEEWLTEHSEKMRELAAVLSQVTKRLDEFPKVSTKGLRAKNIFKLFESHLEHGMTQIHLKKKI